MFFQKKVVPPHVEDIIFFGVEPPGFPDDFIMTLLEFSIDILDRGVTVIFLEKPTIETLGIFLRYLTSICSRYRTVPFSSLYLYLIGKNSNAGKP